jgi:hypothetical protein
VLFGWVHLVMGPGAVWLGTFGDAVRVLFGWVHLVMGFGCCLVGYIWGWGPGAVWLGTFGDAVRVLFAASIAGDIGH